MLNEKFGKKTLVLILALASMVETPAVALVRLPEKAIQCQEMDFESVLNSNHIHFEPRVKNLQAFDIEVDRTLFKGEEIYLNYIRKTCPQTSALNPGDCRFDFAIYKVLPDKSVSDTSEFLALDFKNGKVIHDWTSEGKFQSQDSELPSSCQDLAREYINRENQLNEAYKNKN